jgi:hypothetical protein
MQFKTFGHLLFFFFSDIYKPVFTSCPSHIYASENEKVTWQEPTYYDNVGVLDMSRLGYKSGQVPPAGNHTVYYKVWDYQYNTAVCKFNITVTKGKNLPIVIGSSVFIFIIIVIIVVVNITVIVAVIIIMYNKFIVIWLYIN